jgi:hypothetical protein
MRTSYFTNLNFPGRPFSLSGVGIACQYYDSCQMSCSNRKDRRTDGRKNIHYNAKVGTSKKCITFYMFINVATLFNGFPNKYVAMRMI